MAADSGVAPRLDRDRAAGRGQGRAIALLRRRSAAFGLAVMGLWILIAAFGPFLIRGNPSSSFDYQNLGQALMPPSHAHFLGTDQLGRDEAVRLVQGARYTLLISAAAVAAGLAAGLPLGALSGYLGKTFDLIVQRFVDIILAFPSFLLALALVAFLGTGIRNLIIAIAAASFPRFTRVVRAAVMTVVTQPYAEAADAVGIKRRRILVRHLLPNAMPSVFVQVPLELGAAILTAAGLGYLGFGVPQPTPEWGSMLGQAQNYIFGHSYLVTFPGLCVFTFVLACNLVGDGLRDVFDPRLAGRR
jgi:ABC-type dipeptide/oligopeptide/nickel transport system permease subunit